MTIDPVLADRIAENRQLRADMARAVHLIETGRSDEALTLLRLRRESRDIVNGASGNNQEQ